MCRNGGPIRALRWPLLLQSRATRLKRLQKRKSEQLTPRAAPECPSSPWTATVRRMCSLRPSARRISISSRLVSIFSLSIIKHSLPSTPKQWLRTQDSASTSNPKISVSQSKCKKVKTEAKELQSTSKSSSNCRLPMIWIKISFCTTSYKRSAQLSGSDQWAAEGTKWRIISRLSVTSTTVARSSSQRNVTQTPCGACRTVQRILQTQSTRVNCKIGAMTPWLQVRKSSGMTKMQQAIKEAVQLK